MDDRKKAASTAANLPKGQDKDSEFQSQYKTVYQSFMDYPQTRLQVAIRTGILESNICRYVADMRDKNLIQVIKKGYCPLTHFKAEFLSTDKALFAKPDVQQLTLFDDGI